jgi:hypothetical protein
MSLLDTIMQACRDSHLPMVQTAFGNPGVEAAFQIMEMAKTLYQHVDPERIRGQVVIFRVISPPPEPAPQMPAELPVDFASLANVTIEDLVLEVVPDGRAYRRELGTRTVQEIAVQSVVYRYHAGRDEFLAKTESKVVFRYDASARSQFSVPTLANLRDALQHYARENIRESTCYIFQSVWQDPNRLFLRARPEAVMRNSLVQFLRNRMCSDHDVWPEQIVDESHPVDIRVKPKFSNNRLMLIEIKWLGDSVAGDGHITARHREPRAQEGAQQLAQYLDDQRRFAPSHVVQGYYVVIDARRNNLREAATTISRTDGMHFENIELALNPAPHQTRRDFDPPYRMFARPVCCD